MIVVLSGALLLAALAAVACAASARTRRRAAGTYRLKPPVCADGVSGPSLPAGLLRNFSATLEANCPAFPVDPGAVSLLSAPSDFLDTLKSMCLSAKTRIVLAALYLGTTAKDTELVALSANVSLTLLVILDNNRAWRGSHQGDLVATSSVTLLAPLVREFGTRVQICLYQSPLPSKSYLGIPLPAQLLAWLPRMAKEMFGVFHMKVFVADDSILLSGANLSDLYFVNRQDRSSQADYLATDAAISGPSPACFGTSPVALTVPLFVWALILSLPLSTISVQRFCLDSGDRVLAAGSDTWIYPTVMSGICGEQC
eukprot:gene3923-4292_t